METKPKKERKQLVNDKQSTRTENVKAYIYHLITYMRDLRGRRELGLVVMEQSLTIRRKVCYQ